MCRGKGGRNIHRGSDISITHTLSLSLSHTHTHTHTLPRTHAATSCQNKALL